MSVAAKTYFTAGELAKRAGVAVSTVYLWIRRGSVRAKDFASPKSRYRKMRIRDSEVDRVMRRIASGLPL